MPRNEWFARVLLYWDQVGCILPEAYQPLRFRGAERFAYTQDLIDAGLVLPVSPRMVEHEHGFVSNFLELVDADGELARARPLDVRDAMPVKVHMGKIGLVLLRELEARGLAAPPDHLDSWCPVERRTAGLFMAYLALQLGSLDEFKMVPITDHPDSLQAFTHVPGHARVGSSAIDVRETVLEGVLPAPPSRRSP